MIYSGEEGHTLGANYHFLGDKWALWRALSALWTNPPTKSWQCQHFGCIWSPNPSLNRSTDWECRAPLITVSRFSGGQWKKNHFHYFVIFPFLQTIQCQREAGGRNAFHCLTIFSLHRSPGHWSTNWATGGTNRCPGLWWTRANGSLSFTFLYLS